LPQFSKPNKYNKKNKILLREIPNICIVKMFAFLFKKKYGKDAKKASLG
jgi:hypothetical protein